MFELTDIYNMVMAKYFDLEWEDQDSLAEGYSTYLTLSESEQDQFDELVKQALKSCDNDLKSFPENHQTELDMELHQQVENDITIKLNNIFEDYI